MTKRLALPAVALALLCGCTFAPGGGFATLGPATLEASFDPGGRLGDDGTFLVMGGARVRVTAMMIGVREVVLDEIVVTGGGAGAVFDPASPPPGYTLCHAGHCHHVDGRLVSYEEIQAELSAGGTTTYLPLATLPVGRALDLVIGGVTPLDRVEPSGELPATTIGRTRVELGTFHLEGTVTDGVFGVREVPLYIDVVVAGALSSIAQTLTIGTDADDDVSLLVAFAVPGTFLDEVDLAASEEDGQIRILDGAAADQVAAALLSTPLHVELVRQEGGGE